MCFANEYSSDGKIVLLDVGPVVPEPDAADLAASAGGDTVLSFAESETTCAAVLTVLLLLHTPPHLTLMH